MDSREKRDGKYLEKIGLYNPITDPYELQIDVDRALYWLQQGAQPSDTVRTLLRRKGVLLRFDLIKRGKSEDEIEQEIKKWEMLQEERMKRIEAEKAQKMREAASKKEEAEEEPAKPEKAEAEDAPAEAEKTEAKAEPEEAPAEAEKTEAKAETEEAPAETKSEPEAAAEPETPKTETPEEKTKES